MDRPAWNVLLYGRFCRAGSSRARDVGSLRAAGKSAGRIRIMRTRSKALDGIRFTPAPSCGRLADGTLTPEYAAWVVDYNAKMALVRERQAAEYAARKARKGGGS